MGVSRGLCPEGEGGSTHAPQRELRLRRLRVSMGESCRAVRFVRRIPSRRVLLWGAALASLTVLLTPPPQALARPSVVPTPSGSLGVPAQALLAELDHRNMPNFKNVSANFRGLVFDPGNRYSIPFHGGTSGLLVRTDLVREPVEHWVDPWNSKVGGRAAGWPIQHSLVPIALMADGHAPDSVDPDDLREAAARPGWLKDHAILVANEEATIIPFLVSGQAVAAHGWACDAEPAARQSAPIACVHPNEGTIIWQDPFVVPASSLNQPGAERCLDFMLRRAISARTIEESRYATVNEAALDLMDPAARDNPSIYPPSPDLVTATGLSRGVRRDRPC